MSQTQNAAITITTAEGDRVTLSAGFEAQAEFATYNARGQRNGCGPCGKSSSMQSMQTRSSVSMSVEGDLSQEELRDIRKAVKTLGKAADQLIAGDADGAARQVEKLQGLDTIAGLEAEIQITQQVLVESVSTSGLSPDSSTGGGEQTAPAAKAQTVSAPPLLAAVPAKDEEKATSIRDLIENSGKDRRLTEDSTGNTSSSEN